MLLALLWAPRIALTWGGLLLLEGGRRDFPEVVAGELCSQCSALLTAGSCHWPGSLVRCHDTSECGCWVSSQLLPALPYPDFRARAESVSRQTQTTSGVRQATALLCLGCKRGAARQGPCRVLCGLWWSLGSIRPCLRFSTREMSLITPRRGGSCWGALAGCLCSSWRVKHPAASPP